MQHAAREKTLAGELGSVEMREYCIEIVAQKKTMQLTTDYASQICQ